MAKWVTCLETAFDRPLRRTVAALCFGGVVLSLWGATLAASHPAAGPWLVFLIPIVGLSALGVGTLVGARWAVVVDLIGLGGQIFGVIGVLWELAHFGDSAEAAKVEALGVDPLSGLLTNLGISIVCVALFVLLLARCMSRSLRPPKD